MVNFLRRKPIQPNSGLTGHLWGIPFREDPNAPPNTLYFINESNFEWYAVKNIKRKWRTKIYDTIRAYTRRFKRNKGKD